MAWQRSKEAPMDWGYEKPESRMPSDSPFRRRLNEEPPRKRPHADLSSPPPFGFPSASASSIFPSSSSSSLAQREPSGSFRFGSNTPFLFQTSAPVASSPPTSWAPRSPFDASTAFPGLAFKSDASVPGPEVEMGEATPEAKKAIAFEGKAEGESEHGDKVKDEEHNTTKTGKLPIASGAVIRIQKRRQRGGRRGLARRVHYEDQDGSDTEEFPHTPSRRRRHRPDPASDSDDLSESGSDEEGSRSWIANASPRHLLAQLSLPVMPPMMGPSAQQPVSAAEWPYVLLGWLQFLFNLSLLLAFLYLVINFVVTIQRDVDKKVEEYSLEILQEITHCSRSYIDNRCDPSTRIPVSEAACQAWEHCMNRDPTVVGRAKVGAETFASVIDGFVEKISWKTLAFGVISTTSLIFATNTTLSFFRMKLPHPSFGSSSRNDIHHPDGSAHAPGQAAMSVPPTPSAHHITYHQSPFVGAGGGAYTSGMLTGMGSPAATPSRRRSKRERRDVGVH